MKSMRFCHEKTLNALLIMVDGLSNNSYNRNLMTGIPVWLNTFSHVLGVTDN